MNPHPHTDNLTSPVYLGTVEDLFSRRMLGFALSDRYPTAELAKAAVNMAIATRGGTVEGVIFHTDRGSQYNAEAFTKACARLGIVQSMGRVGSALDNAAAESFFSTLQLERINNRRYATRTQARQDIANWIHTWYNQHRLHSTLDMIQPHQLRKNPRNNLTNSPRFGGNLTPSLPESQHIAKPLFVLVVGSAFGAGSRYLPLTWGFSPPKEGQSRNSPGFDI